MGWILTEDDVQSIAVGAGVLSTGGGGDPYRGQLQLIRLIRQGKQVEVIPAHSLADDALGCATGGMGAPTIGMERLPAGDTHWRSVQALEENLHTRFSFIAVGEVGGSNAIGPLVAGAYSGLPVVDADPMGRAFPELQMNTFMIYGVSPSPFGLADARGNQVVLHVNDAVTAERLGRAVTIAMGGSASLALPVITGKQLKQYSIHGTVSLCHRIGQAVRAAIREKGDVIQAIASEVTVQHLFTGKVTDVERRTTGGFARGYVMLDGLGEFSGSQMRIDIQNEYLVAMRDGRLAATVPDLICALDAEGGLPVGTESLRYGLRLHILGIPASRKLKTEQALKVVGPRAFGYETDFVPLSGELPDEQIG